MKYNSWHQGSIDLSKIGFFLTTSEAEAQLEVDLSQVQQCPLHDISTTAVPPRPWSPMHELDGAHATEFHTRTSLRSRICAQALASLCLRCQVSCSELMQVCAESGQL